MNDFVMVPRREIERLLDYLYNPFEPDNQSKFWHAWSAIAAAPPVAAEPVAYEKWMGETVPVPRGLICELVDLLELGDINADTQEFGWGEVFAQLDALAEAEAQPALPTQEEVMRLADEYSDWKHEVGFAGSIDADKKCQKARAALLAALAALPRGGT